MAAAIDCYCLLIQEVKTMSNPNVASNLMKPMTVPGYGTVAKCVHQLLVYIWSRWLPKTQA